MRSCENMLAYMVTSSAFVVPCCIWHVYINEGFRSAATLENRLIPMISSAAITFVASVLAHRVVEAKSPQSSFIPNTFPNLSGCVSEPSFFSCENTTAIKNTCCSPTPGGLVLQTQFWNTWTGLEKHGQKLPKGSWTIHGLWLDNCDGYAIYLEIQDQVSS